MSSSLTSTRHAERPRGARVLCCARSLYGLTLLLAAGPVARAVGAPSHARVVRLLGARHLVQAGWTARRGDRARLREGALIDAVHGLSMALVAFISPPNRRAGATNATLAAGWALAGARIARGRQQPGPAPGDPGGRDPS